MSGLRLRDEQVAAIGRYVGVALILTGLAVAINDFGDRGSSFAGGRFWAFLWPIHLTVIMGSLLLATAALLSQKRRPDWAVPVGNRGPRRHRRVRSQGGGHPGDLG